MSFKDALEKQHIFVDGATGTQLQACGLALGEAPMLWNMQHPEKVVALHRAYLEAGANIITANTFGANALNLVKTPFSVHEVVSSGIQLAQRAREQSGAEAFIALDISPSGRLLEPLGPLSFDEAYDLFREQVQAGVAAGADLVLIETMIDTYELKAAILAAKEESELPVLATVTVSEQGRLLTGADLSCVCALMEGLGVNALGINCGFGPEQVAPSIEILSSISATPLIVSPNAGLPQVIDGKTVYPAEIDEFVAWMAPLVENHVSIAGGCCGTTPRHIEALVEACRQMQPHQRTDQRRRVASSASRVVLLDEAEIKVDYRIDPAKDAALAESLALNDLSVAESLALSALDDDVQVLRIAAIHPQIDEIRTLPALVQSIQTLVRMPLCIASSETAAFERALRLSNGCPLVDLSHFKGDTRKAAAAIAAHYGAVVWDCP